MALCKLGFILNQHVCKLELLVSLPYQILAELFCGIDGNVSLGIYVNYLFCINKGKR
jgi:hypothetical protein